MENLEAEGHIPSSRQKSCKSCVQGKRRCDRRLPLCSRCAKRSIPCVYAGPKTLRQFASPVVRQSSAVTLLPNEDLAYSLLHSDLVPNLRHLESASTEIGLHAAVMAMSESTPTLNMIPTNIPDDPMSLFTNWMSSEGMSPGHLSLTPVDQNLMFERPSSPLDKKNAMAYENMGEFCVSFTRCQNKSSN